MSYDAYRVRIAIWNNLNSDYVIDHDITTADNQWAKRPFILSSRHRSGKRYISRFATFEGVCAGAVRHRLNQLRRAGVEVPVPRTLQDRAKALHDAMTLARDLELEAQSASGDRWVELRGTDKRLGLVWEAEVKVKQRQQLFVESLVEATGFGRTDLQEMIR